MMPHGALGCQVSQFGAFLDVAVDVASRGALWVWALPGNPAGVLPLVLESLTFVCTYHVRNICHILPLIHFGCDGMSYLIVHIWPADCECRSWNCRPPAIVESEMWHVFPLLLS
jgi:hypothetical protein